MRDVFRSILLGADAGVSDAEPFKKGVSYWLWVKKMLPLGFSTGFGLFSFNQTGFFWVPGIFDP